MWTDRSWQARVGLLRSQRPGRRSPGEGNRTVGAAYPHADGTPGLPLPCLIPHCSPTLPPFVNQQFDTAGRVMK